MACPLLFNEHSETSESQYRFRFAFPVHRQFNRRTSSKTLATTKFQNRK